MGNSEQVKPLAGTPVAVEGFFQTSPVVGSENLIRTNQKSGLTGESNIPSISPTELLDETKAVEAVRVNATDMAAMSFWQGFREDGVVIYDSQRLNPTNLQESRGFLEYVSERPKEEALDKTVIETVVQKAEFKETGLIKAEPKESDVNREEIARRDEQKIQEARATLEAEMQQKETIHSEEAIHPTYHHTAAEIEEYREELEKEAELLMRKIEEAQQELEDIIELEALELETYAGLKWLIRQFSMTVQTMREGIMSPLGRGRLWHGGRVSDRLETAKIRFGELRKHKSTIFSSVKA